MATQAQIDFLAILHEERGLDFDASAYESVANEDASADIDTLIRDVGSDEAPSEEQVAEIIRIREFLGPREGDTMPTDKLGAARLLRALKRAEWARRRELSRQRFVAAGAKLQEPQVSTSEETPPAAVVEDDEIPF